MTEQRTFTARQWLVIILSAAAGLLALVILTTNGSDQPEAQPSWDYAAVEPTPAPAAEDTAIEEDPVAPVAFTKAEDAYLKDLRKELDEEDGFITYDSDTEAVQAGHEVCDEGKPTVSEIADVTSDAPYGPAIRHLCPKYLPQLRKAEDAIDDGKYAVGKNMKPGTYRTDGAVSDCYWERSTGNGNIIANQFISNAPSGVTVTVRSGEGFTSEGCGVWIRS